MCTIASVSFGMRTSEQSDSRKRLHLQIQLDLLSDIDCAHQSEIVIMIMLAHIDRSVRLRDWCDYSANVHILRLVCGPRTKNAHCLPELKDENIMSC